MNDSTQPRTAAATIKATIRTLQADRDLLDQQRADIDTAITDHIQILRAIEQAATRRNIPRPPASAPTTRAPRQTGQPLANTPATEQHIRTINELRTVENTPTETNTPPTDTQSPSEAADTSPGTQVPDKEVTRSTEQQDAQRRPEPPHPTPNPTISDNDTDPTTTTDPDHTNDNDN